MRTKPFERKEYAMKALRFSIVAVCLILALLLVGCGKDPETPLPGTSGESETATGTGGSGDKTQPEEVSISMKDLSRYSIIYSERAESTLMEKANELSKLIKNSLGVFMQVKDDYYNEVSTSYRVSDYEILIGNTNRPESLEYVNGLLYRDSGYQLSGKKLVIAGKDDFQTEQAVADFMLNVVFNLNSESPTFFSASQAKCISGDYRHTSLKLNGQPIGDYRIVIPADGTSFEAGLATRLNLAIAEDCGYLLPIVRDSEAWGGEFEIRIGKTSRASDYSETDPGAGYAKTDGKAVLLYGDSALGNTTAVNALISAIEKDGNKETDLSITDGAIALVSETGGIRTMTFNLQIWAVTDARMERVRDTILTYLPDTVGLQEGSREWHDYLVKELGDYYVLYGTEREELSGTAIEYVPILYAREKFDFVDGGTFWLTDTPDKLSLLPGCEYYRTVTWAILRNRLDGKKFMHLNQHWDTAPAETGVREREAELVLDFLSDYSELACVLTGDFNCGYASPEFQLLTFGRFTNSSDICKQMNNGTFSVTAMIDFLVVSDDYIDVLQYEIANRRIHGGYASDHRAALIDFIIDYNGTEMLDKTHLEKNGLTIQPDVEGKHYGPPHRV